MIASGLPDLSEKEVLKAIHLYRTIPIIMVTAHGDKRLREECLLSGANQFLTKPVSSKNLNKTINFQI